jgi:phosphatidylglycerophosphate synthase
VTDNLAKASARISRVVLARLWSQLALALLGGTGLTLVIALVLVGPTLVPLSLAVAGYGLGAIFAIAMIRRGYPHSGLGTGNVVTMLRMSLVAALLAPLAGITLPWALVGVATIALVLDGFDGFFARREGRVSAFGARLDMEVDSALGLILALNVWAAGVFGPLILLIALPSYVFMVAGRFLPWLRQPLPESFARKLVCVVQVASLIALNAPIWPTWGIVPVVVGVAGALAWSFGRDIVWLWRSRS